MATLASMTQQGHRAWLCDLDGTLYRPLGLKLVMGAELVLFGRSELRVIRTFRREHELLRASGDMGVLTANPFEQQIERTAARLSMTPAAVRTSVERWMVERPLRWLGRFKRGSLCNEIDQFREAGGSTALVSDYPASRKLEALGMRELFDVVVASGEPGGPELLKPSPQGYLKAARALGVEPAGCLVIGDRLDTDGAAARAAGMDFRLIA